MIMNSPVTQPEKEGSSKVWLILIQVVLVLTFFVSFNNLFSPNDLWRLHTLGHDILAISFTFVGYIYPTLCLILILRSWQVYRQGKYRQAILLSLSPIFFILIAIFLLVVLFIGGSLLAALITTSMYH